MGAGSCSGKRVWTCMRPTAIMRSRGDHRLVTEFTPAQKPGLITSRESLLQTFMACERSGRGAASLQEGFPAIA